MGLSRRRIDVWCGGLCTGLYLFTIEYQASTRIDKRGWIDKRGLNPIWEKEGVS